MNSWILDALFMVWIGFLILVGFHIIFWFVLKYQDLKSKEKLLNIFIRKFKICEEELDKETRHHGPNRHHH